MKLTPEKHLFSGLTIKGQWETLVRYLMKKEVRLDAKS